MAILYLELTFYLLIVSSHGNTGDIYAVNMAERVPPFHTPTQHSSSSDYQLRTESSMSSFPPFRSSYCKIVLQVFCVFLFMAGVCVFGTIVSNTNTVLTEIGREAAQLAERMEGYQMLISSCRCVLYPL
jgi:hypothetical protein